VTESSQAIKTVLHVGCGYRDPRTLHETFRPDQWREIRLDIDPAVKPDIVASITNMNSVADASVDAVWSSHNLEHLLAHEVSEALGEFLRVLKPGGFTLLTLPDLQAVAEQVAQGNLEDAVYQSPAGPICPIDMIYGHRGLIAQGNSHMVHRTGFTAQSLANRLSAAGFGKTQVQRRKWDLWAIAHK